MIGPRFSHATAKIGLRLLLGRFWLGRQQQPPADKFEAELHAKPKVEKVKVASTI